MTSDDNSAGTHGVDDTATDGSSARERLENDLDPLAKGEAAGLAASPSPEAQDGGRPDGLPAAQVEPTLAGGGSLEEPGASNLEGTAS